MTLTTNKGLNPCYNGMTIELDLGSTHLLTLNSLNPCYNGMTIE